MQDQQIAQYDDWMHVYYDPWYPELHNEQLGPFSPMQQLIEWHLPANKIADPASVTILDAACGTGNNYIAFSRRGYAMFGTDGSLKMLAHAVENSKAAGVATDRLIVEPVNWTDTDAYARHFLSKGIRFDVVLLNSNSLCHLPAKEGYVDKALGNFLDLLAPSGILIVDTKRYGDAPSIDGIRMYHELRYVDGAWKERGERVDGPRVLSERGNTTFRTRMRYDTDPDHRVCRAFVEVTIESADRPVEMRELSYFPLPAGEIEGWMLRTGTFVITRYAAKSKPLNWSYDTIVARRLA